LLVACSAHKPPARPDDKLGAVEGLVVDARTGAALAGVDVTIGGPCRGGDDVAWTLTDEHGFYRVELGRGICDLSARFGAASADRDGFEIRPAQTIVVDLTLDHAKVRAALRKDPPVHCPSSRPNAIIEGHTTSQADLDAVAAAVLERSATDKGWIPDAGDTAFVLAEIGPGRHLTTLALKPGFILKTKDALQADADRLGTDVRYIDFWSIYSDGTCAIVSVRGSLMMPRKQFRMMCACCDATDVYEKRRGRWAFVRRL
jgi:hypothetical protein